MLPETTTPCRGKAALFDSTDPGDHLQAKAMCDECPLIVACAERLEETRRMWGNAGPKGTWAGRLVGRSGPERDVVQTPCGTRAGYDRHRRRGEETCPDCRAAHREHAQRNKQRARNAA